MSTLFGSSSSSTTSALVAEEEEGRFSTTKEASPPAAKKETSTPGEPEGVEVKKGTGWGWDPSSNEAWCCGAPPLPIPVAPAWLSPQLHTCCPDASKTSCPSPSTRF